MKLWETTISEISLKWCPSLFLISVLAASAANSASIAPSSVNSDDNDLIIPFDSSSDVSNVNSAYGFVWDPNNTPQPFLPNNKNVQPAVGGGTQFDPRPEARDAGIEVLEQLVEDDEGAKALDLTEIERMRLKRNLLRLRHMRSLYLDMVQHLPTAATNPNGQFTPNSAAIQKITEKLYEQFQKYEKEDQEEEALRRQILAGSTAFIRQTQSARPGDTTKGIDDSYSSKPVINSRLERAKRARKALLLRKRLEGILNADSQTVQSSPSISNKKRTSISSKLRKAWDLNDSQRTPVIKEIKEVVQSGGRKSFLPASAPIGFKQSEEDSRNSWSSLAGADELAENEEEWNPTRKTSASDSGGTFDVQKLLEIRDLIQNGEELAAPNLVKQLGDLIAFRPTGGGGGGGGGGGEGPGPTDFGGIDEIISFEELEPGAGKGKGGGEGGKGGKEVKAVTQRRLPQIVNVDDRNAVLNVDIAATNNEPKGSNDYTHIVLQGEALTLNLAAKVLSGTWDRNLMQIVFQPRVLKADISAKLLSPTISSQLLSIVMRPSLLDLKIEPSVLSPRLRQSLLGIRLEPRLLTQQITPKVLSPEINTQLAYIDLRFGRLLEQILRPKVLSPEMDLQLLRVRPDFQLFRQLLQPGVLSPKVRLNLLKVTPKVFDEASPDVATGVLNPTITCDIPTGCSIKSNTG